MKPTTLSNIIWIIIALALFIFTISRLVIVDIKCKEKGGIAVLAIGGYKCVEELK